MIGLQCMPPEAKVAYASAIDSGLTETYPAAQLTLTQSAAGQVKFYYDPVTHYVRDNVARIAVSPGSFQSELGCPGDWQPDCLKSWLQDPDGDGIFTFTTTAIPPPRSNPPTATPVGTKPVAPSTIATAPVLTCLLTDRSTMERVDVMEVLS